MKRKIKVCLCFVFMVILTACYNSTPEEASDLILTPESSAPILEGTWQVTKVDKVSEKSSDNHPEIGDRLYINKNIVAINSEYAFPPVFTSKYVNLNDYIKNRGFSFNNIDQEESVVVINASQGQFFARDFVKRSDDEIFYIADDNLVYLKKVSNDVDTKIIDEYTNIATKDRIKQDNSEDVRDEIALLLGVRERIDTVDGKQDYDYYSYLLKISKDGKINYMKAQDVFLRGQDEYWKVRSRKNKVSGLYDNIEAFPVRIESDMDKQENKERYSFKDFDMNMKLTYVGFDYISFAYSRLLFDNTIVKYGVVETGDLDDNLLLNIDEFTGEKDASSQFETMVLNEATTKISDINTEDIVIDDTNFGMVRDTGNWIMQSSIYTDESQQRTASQIPIRTPIDDINMVETTITRDQIRNINSQFKDYFVVGDSNFIVIQTADEILFHRTDDGYIEEEPYYSISTPNPTAFVSIDLQSGQNAQALSLSLIHI